SAASLNAWSAIGSAILAVVSDSTRLSASMPNVLQVTIPSGSGTVGFRNSGYFDIQVNSQWTYTASFYYRFPSIFPTSSLSATVQLASTTGHVFASATATLSSTGIWTQVKVSLKPALSASNISNVFRVTLNDASLSSRINFNLSSLFPPTWQNQVNGIRRAIAEVLADLKQPLFFRFLGGNNLEGQTTATRWEWNIALDPPFKGPVRKRDWIYINTDSLCFYEYCVWIKFMGTEPIMGICAGYSLGRTALPQAQLAQYMEQARRWIEFVVDSTNTSGGALRASLDHLEHLKLNYVGVGNEDFSGSYFYRWNSFVSTLQADPPNIRSLARSYYNRLVLNPRVRSYGTHIYRNPCTPHHQFICQIPEQGGTTFFEGKSACISTILTNVRDFAGQLTHPLMQGSISQAAFIIGLERNADIVFVASYTPLLGHATQHRWTPNPITIDSRTVIRSSGCYIQQMPSVNHGYIYLLSTPASTSGVLFWPIVKESSSVTFVKVVNGGPSAIASFKILIQPKGSANDSNTPYDPTLVTPQTSAVATSRTFTVSASAMNPSEASIPLT
ncbi:glycoside hydrolase superfamily, partial [Vararia minispora EC-137]